MDTALWQRPLNLLVYSKAQLRYLLTKLIMQLLRPHFYQASIRHREVYKFYCQITFDAASLELLAFILVKLSHSILLHIFIQMTQGDISICKHFFFSVSQCNSILINTEISVTGHGLIGCLLHTYFVNMYEYRKLGLIY